MSKVVPGSGSPESNLWFIGEAPAQTEVVEGKPFVGNAGMTLRRFCMQVGIDPNDCYLDNIYNKRVPSDKLQSLFKQGTPTLEVAESIERLNKKIEKYRPNLIVTLGAIPSHVLTGWLSWNPEYGTFTPLQDIRGCVLEHKSISGQKIISTYHPSYINREGYSDHGIFIADLTRILGESAFPEIRRPEKELILNPKGKELFNVRDRLIEEGEIITVDIEFIQGKLLCVGLTTGSDWATSIVTTAQSNVEICKEIITCGKPLNMQNAAFDYSILEWHYGIEAVDFLKYDTMLAAHAINPELPKDLGFLHSIYSECPYPYKNMVNWNNIKKGKQPIEDVYEYNATDAWVQHEIMEKQILEDFMDNQNIHKVFLFEMQLIKPLWEMSKRGIKVDPHRRADYAQELLTGLHVDKAMLRVLNGGKELNVKSGPQVAEMLFDYLGIRSGGKTKKGSRKVDDKTMASLLSRCNNEQQKLAIKHIRAAREKRDMLSKFVKVPLDDDGRTRGMYNPGGTVTGRLASKKFYPTNRGHQQQNIPVKGREILVADDGYLFGSADKERIESHIVAHLTNDPIMLEHHAPGADAHTLLAMMFFDCEREEVSYDRRFIMKKTRHAGNYIEGHITFMRDVNRVAHLTGVSITAKEAEKFIDWYRSVHVGLKPWWLSTKNKLYEEHKLITLLGRERTFFNRVDSILPEAVAYVPQGTAGDYTNISILNVSGIVCEKAKELLDWHEEIPEIGKELKSCSFQLLNQVHDSMGFQFKPKYETRVLELVMKCMDIPLYNPHNREEFRIGTEIKVGRDNPSSWGAAS